MHSKVWPFCAGTAVGQTTVVWMWRSLRTLSSMDRATCEVLTVFVAVDPVDDGEDEPQALRSAAQVSAEAATRAPRGARMAREMPDVGVRGSMCMGAY